MAEPPLIILHCTPELMVWSGLPFDAKCSGSLVPFLDFWCWCKSIGEYCPHWVTQYWHYGQFSFFLFIVTVLFISLLAFSETQWLLATSLLRSVPAVKHNLRCPSALSALVSCTSQLDLFRLGYSPSILYRLLLSPGFNRHKSLLSTPSSSTHWHSGPLPAPWVSHRKLEVSRKS